MAHEIDMSNGKAAMAYKGQVPWHGLGESMDPDADIDTWIQAAGFDWELRPAPVTYHNEVTGEYRQLDNRNVLYRSDNGNPISVVSDRYKIVQPQDVAEFFRKFVEAGGFEMETMGVLRGGAKYWALAKAGKGFTIGSKADSVRPYVLLGTSADGSMSTVAHLTSVRVVCQNTMQIAVGGSGKKAMMQIPHLAHFNPDAVAEELGLIPDWWEQYEAESKAMASRAVSREEAVRFFLDILAPRKTDTSVLPDDDLAGLLEEGWELDPNDKEDENLVSIARVRSKVLTLMDVYENGVGQGAKSAKGTAFGLVNAMTRYWDHEYGSSQDNRLTWSWFGGGTNQKQEAHARAKALVTS